MAGEIVHVEFPAADADRAQGFWKGLFGWEFKDSGMPGMDYRMADAGQKGVAVFPASAMGGSPGTPSYYYAVDDIDAAVEKVRDLGGSADEKMPVPGHGWFAAAKDTEGNAFHLWQSDSGAGPPS